MDAIASHLPKHFADYFCVARLVVNGSSAVLTIDDGNDNVYATQAIEYTDFPLNEIKLYCSFDGEYWVIMLTSEYWFLDDSLANHHPTCRRFLMFSVNQIKWWLIRLLTGLIRQLILI